MVYLATPEEWQRESALLLQARPTTTRITTKYKIPNLNDPKYAKALKRKRDGETEDKEEPSAKVPRGSLVLKTYDPESGVVLKVRTDKAADVGRLITGLGRLGRHMAALPEKAEDSVMEDAPAAESSAPAAAAPSEARTAGPGTDGKSQPAPTVPGGGGGKKKKKGKK
ncbi:hypothetical protein LTR62_000152 [Meristemomyces frigidus]|uniref:SRP9 domain-containing protein n=1 Tax=Meristemomyces frigidus TaxID=1508187 RepID=A0AAN7TXJ8_9PEZI|nr:hypothetical protein LTR62_000152 [Meristemomyces frigidus]